MKIDIPNSNKEETIEEIRIIQRLHTQAINDLTSSLVKLEGHLEAIELNFVKIKYGVFGALTLFSLDSFGLIELIKRIL